MISVISHFAAILYLNIIYYNFIDLNILYFNEVDEKNKTLKLQISYHSLQCFFRNKLFTIIYQQELQFQ